MVLSQSGKDKLCDAMREPLISVIVPVYKVERYLSKCVESILGQTYSNLEVFLVDDGSPDHCGAICDAYAGRDARVKVIHKENGGLSDARNVAIDVARGEYITFVDSDDYVAETYVETLYRLVGKYGCEISVVLWQSFVEGSMPEVPQIRKKECCFSALQAIESMFYQEKFDTAACAKLYHRSLFESGIRYPKGLLFEDLPTTYLLFAHGRKVAFSNERLYYYMWRKDSIEGSVFSPAKMDSAMRIFDSMDSHSEITSQVESAFRCRMISFSFHILLKMPSKYERRDMLWRRILAYRNSVLLDCRARKKARAACLLSYLGMRTVRRLFRIIDKRK